MTEKNQFSDVLVIGAGITGIEASLLLSKADRQVHLVEKTSYTGGTTIKFEEVFSNM
jgi:heterodisulfide reductase subunit A-like polyferredoxin